IPIREGLVWGSVVPRGSQDAASIPAILPAELPGLRSPGVKDLKGEAVAPTPESPSRTLSEGVIASASGQVVLTLNGACPFFNGPREVARDIPFENLAAYLVVN